jgi:hypothetical protein
VKPQRIDDAVIDDHDPTTAVPLDRITMAPDTCVAEDDQGDDKERCGCADDASTLVADALPTHTGNSGDA